MSAADIAFACASILAERFAAAGLAAVCVSPGSRSTPLALAFARSGAVPMHVHLDERSSAFFALGLAKAARAPVALVCTSGTAAANYLPAVVEASLSRVPLLVLTADRPPSLRNTGANQTIDQVNLYGRYPRLFVDAPVPAPGSAATWAALADDALRAALGSPPGPVHLNLPFDEPLVPTGAPVDLGPAPAIAPLERASEEPGADDAGVVRDLLEQNERGVVFAGTLEEVAPSIAELARRAGWPLLAEPGSNLRAPGALTAWQHVLSSFEPDVVLQVGRAPTARTTQGFIARARSLVVVETPGVPADPARAAARTIVCSAEALARAVLFGHAMPAERDAGEWFASWNAADRIARGAVDELLDTMDEPFEPRIARDVAAAVPEDGALFAGNSMPIRDLDAFMRPRAGIRVFANRGASGIDGTVSTALGVAATGVPTVALLGDLAMLHDASGLLWAARQAPSIVFVVPNNGGGAIFDLLAQRGIAEHEKLFVTPHGVDLHQVAAAAGVHYARAEHGTEVGHAVAHGLSHEGAWLVDVLVDRALSLQRRDAVRDAVARALNARA